MSLPREGSLADQELGPCQEVGWYRETARDVLKRLEGCEHQRRASEQGPHRVPQCDGERHERTVEKKSLSIQFFRGETRAEDQQLCTNGGHLR